jgi:tetratricopeptide (TPR) repeat protein
VGDDPASVADDLGRALAIEPEAIGIRLRLAALESSAGRKREARDLLEAAMREVPDDPAPGDALADLYLEMAHWHLSRRDAEQAFQAASRAVAVRPSLPPALVFLGELHEQRGEWKVAEGLYLRALDRDPAHVDARRGMARFLVARGLGTLSRMGELGKLPEERREEAAGEVRAAVREDFLRAIEYAGDAPDADPARSWLRNADRREPSGAADELCRRAVEEVRAGRLVEALALLELAVREDGTDPRNWYLLSRVAYEHKDYALARKALDQTLALEPEHLDALVDSARLHYIRGETQAALKACRRFLRLVDVPGLRERAAARIETVREIERLASGG